MVWVGLLWCGWVCYGVGGLVMVWVGLLWFGWVCYIVLFKVGVVSEYINYFSIHLISLIIWTCYFRSLEFERIIKYYNFGRSIFLFYVISKLVPSVFVLLLKQFKWYNIKTTTIFKFINVVQLDYFGVKGCFKVLLYNGIWGGVVKYMSALYNMLSVMQDICTQQDTWTCDVMRHFEHEPFGT